MTYDLHAGNATGGSGAMDDEGGSTIAVSVSAPAWLTALEDPPRTCRRAVAAALAPTCAGTWAAGAEVSILLADDAAVRGLNARYRGQDRPTNVLSFPALDLVPGTLPPAPPGPHFLGDLALGAETVAAEAAAQGKTVEDHLVHLVVHGTLHLLGYDHDREAAAERMEHLERLILGGLGVADPYGAAPGDGRDALEGVS